MNITSFDSYIICCIKWQEGYIPWHAELFRCRLNSYKPCYVTLKSSTSPPSPPNPLACWFAANRKQRVHCFTPAFEGDHWSQPCIPPSRGTQHSHNTRQFVDSVAPKIDIQRNLQHACSLMQIGLHHLKQMTLSHCRFFFVLKIILVYARVWPETQAVAQKKW